MIAKKHIRSVTFEQAAEEDLKYSLSLTPLQRLQRLENLRRINLGNAASSPVTKKIVLVNH